MGVNDYGQATEKLNNPSLTTWAAGVAAVLDASDTPVSTRLAGKAGVDASGRIAEAALPETILAMLAAYNAGSFSGGLGRTLTFLWDGADYVTGPSEPAFIPESSSLSIGPMGTLSPDPGSTPAVFTVETATAFAGPWTDRYTSGKPTIPAGQAFAQGAPPASKVVNAGSWLRVKPSALPAGPSGSSTPTTQVGAPTLYDTGTQTLPTAPGPAVPPSGERVLMFVAANASVTTTFSTDFGPPLINAISDPTTSRVRALCAAGGWKTGMDMSLVNSPTAGPLVAAAITFNGLSATNPFGDSATPIGGDGVTGGVFATPGGAATVNCDQVIYFAALWYPANANGYHLTGSGGTGALTELCDVVTSRPTSANYALWVASAPGVAAGATIPPVSLTIAGGSGTGVVANAAHVAGWVTLRRASSATGPTRLTVQVFLTKA